MVIINFKKECNIPTFSRHRKGWAKKITGLNKEHPNGYSLEGEFVRLGNFDTNLTDGIYLDCSKKPNDDGEVEKTYHLFTVEDGKITLLQTEEDCRGWAVKFWDNIEKYLNKDGLTAEYLVNLLKERTTDKELLQEVASLLQESQKEDLYPNYYNTTYFRGIAKEMSLVDMDCGYFIENSQEGSIYENGVKVLKEHEGFELFEKEFYKHPSIYTNKAKIVSCLNTFYGKNLWDENAPKIKVQFHDNFEKTVVDFNNRSTVQKYGTGWEASFGIGFYTLAQQYTNTWAVRGIIVFHYDEENRTLIVHKFGAYFGQP